MTTTLCKGPNCQRPLVQRYGHWGEFCDAQCEREYRDGMEGAPVDEPWTGEELDDYSRRSEGERGETGRDE